MATTVYVKNIAAQTDDKEVKDFFSFCGKITSLDVTSEGGSKSATVTFEKPTAAKTALLLNNTKLGDQEIHVSGSEDGEDEAPSASKDNADRDTDELTQEEKPRTRILAEYLAHGYLVADTGLQTAISLDEKHGVSQKFLGTLQSLDSKYHATDRARAADQGYGITTRANSLLTGLGSYFEKAAHTPTGKRIVDFYTAGTRQVADIHNEAKRLADLKKQEAGGSAYKAAGLERVFGKEKPASPDGSAASGAAPADAAATESAQQPIAPSGFGAPTQLPKV
ncbi:hypothetical protein B0T24DRAFT_92915 [Lasiosphaeria ovina]|uniref:RRM domain-containing protein n=1 Tax=Lasiosphaeria ovina TaxID=92902 RepID=A0AAE0TYZ6_9PEZI|nr:hypothetical protein B0T24DRAFT_92915 [Lasiosphaeria ovina]